MQCGYIMFLLAGFISIIINESSQYDKFMIDFLIKFGYVSKMNNSSNADELNWLKYTNEEIEIGMTLFKQYYNLVHESSFNEIIKSMKEDRCGVKEDVFNLNQEQLKWNKKKLYWHFILSLPEQIATTVEVFKIWSNMTGLEFNHTNEKQYADIVISLEYDNHYYKLEPNIKCTGHLAENVLGHAFLPDKENSPREIHIRRRLNWFYGLGEIPEEKSSLFYVLMHEVGHTLGLSHNHEGRLMQPTYLFFKNTNDNLFNNIDILDIQRLYNIENNYNDNQEVDRNKISTTTITPSVSTTKPTTIAPPAITTKPTTRVIKKSYYRPKNEIPPKFDDVCETSSKDFVYLITDGTLFIMYGKWFWHFEVHRNKKKRYYRNGKLIRDFLTFLPSNFTRITAIHEIGVGKIVLYSDNNVYIFDALTRELDSGYPRTYQQLLGNYVNYDGVKAAVLTNSGKVYIFYTPNYVMELSSCEVLKPNKFTTVESVFQTEINFYQNFTLFKYTNGKIYIIQNDMYKAYDEFMGIIVKSDKFDLSLFNIECSSITLGEKLKTLMVRMLTFYGDDTNHYHNLKGNYLNDDANNDNNDDDEYNNDFNDESYQSMKGVSFDSGRVKRFNSFAEVQKYKIDQIKKNEL
ncbi:collagenase 3-like [Prorops nasuta]|uniref:collagenase 3-like n=1 Tax=Prorops nasuta TaxID=863751 RepID=UPI0034CF5005